MKKIIFIAAFSAIAAIQLYAQNGASINTTGSTADPSAILDISSVNSGVLIPRMTEAQKNSISSPATGLMIYQTDAVKGFWYYDGTTWVQAIGPAGPAGNDGATGPQGIQGATGAQGPAGAAGVTGPAGPLVSGTAGQTLRHDGSTWTANSTLYNNGTSIGIGTTSPEPTAVLDVSSTSKGMLLPRMTTTERNNISGPANSLVIYNTTTNCYEAYVNSQWQSIYCCCGSPSAGINTPSKTQIVWNWSQVSGATSYNYNTTNDYSTATSNGTSTTYTQTGLTCNTSYTLYVWAVCSCGVSGATVIVQQTLPCWVCGDDLSKTHSAGSVAPVTKTVTYKTVSLASHPSGTNKCWIAQNLGADVQASDVNDNRETAAGWYWQFNRKQGYKYDASRVPSTSWNGSISESSDWTPANDPCVLLLGTGWRIPTTAEWNYVDGAGSWYNYNMSYASNLVLSPAGYLRNSDGVLLNRGALGYYWTSNQNGTTNGWYFYMSNSQVGIEIWNPYAKAHGFTLRCLKD